MVTATRERTGSAQELLEGVLDLPVPHLTSPACRVAPLPDEVAG
jgi:hypothetical protein